MLLLNYLRKLTTKICILTIRLLRSKWWRFKKISPGQSHLKSRYQKLSQWVSSSSCPCPSYQKKQICRSSHSKERKIGKERRIFKNKRNFWNSISCKRIDLWAPSKVIEVLHRAKKSKLNQLFKIEKKDLGLKSDNAASSQLGSLNFVHLEFTITINFRQDSRS